MKISKAWLQTYFEQELPSIQEIDQLLVTHSFETEGIEKVGDDDVLDIDVLPNRAHDCLSYEGIAQELAGLMGVQAKDTLSRYNRFHLQLSTCNFSVQIKNPEQCRRYAARVIENVKVQESPQWLKDRLATMGQRSINNIVDATNYVLFDFGQPTHVFDFAKIDGGITVRNAEEQEKITVLGGQEIEMDASMLIIADDQQPLALAGVKGGVAAEVNAATTTIVLEVANFEPASTRTTRNKVGIFTDASKRYENELSPEVVGDSIEALTRLIIEVAGSEATLVSEVIDHYPTKQELAQVVFTTEHTNRLTGLALSDEEIVTILENFNYSFTTKEGIFIVEIPSRRYDLRIAEDMIEEIGRIYGYYKLEPKSVADLDWNPQVNKMMYYQNAIRNILVAEGYSELMTYTFVEKGEVEMLNALASDKKALRTNLAGGFTEALMSNLRNTELFGTDRVAAFEFGKVFEGGEERWQLVIGVENKDKKARKKHGQPHEQLKNIADILNTAFSIDLFSAPTEGSFWIEWNLETLVEKLPAVDSYRDVLVLKEEDLQKQFTPFSLFPFMSRDIALWAPSSITPTEIRAILASHATSLCQRIDLFDTYQPDSAPDGAPQEAPRTSYAFKLIFQAMDRTLTDEEINPIMDGVYKACEEKGWETR